MVANPSDGFVLWLWLDVCKRRGRPQPEGTREVVVENDLSEHIAGSVLVVDGYTMPSNLVWEAFGGLPVKQVRGLIEYMKNNMPEEVIEYDNYLRYKAGQRRVA